MYAPLFWSIEYVKLFCVFLLISLSLSLPPFHSQHYVEIQYKLLNMHANVHSLSEFESSGFPSNLHVDS